MKKRGQIRSRLAFILVIALVLGMTPWLRPEKVALADTEFEKTKAQYEAYCKAFSVGKGTKNDINTGFMDKEYFYYKIRTADDLNKLADLVNSGTSFGGMNLQLTEDIAYTPTDGSNFTPIGTYDNPFSGTFDGIYRKEKIDMNGNTGFEDAKHTISGIRVRQSEKNGMGLFGYTNGGTIKNVNISDAVIVGNSMVGGIVGSAGGTSGSINHCTVVDSYIKSCATGTDVNMTGAIAGHMSGPGASTNYYSGCRVNSEKLTLSGVGSGNVSSEPNDSAAIGPLSCVSGDAYVSFNDSNIVDVLGKFYYSKGNIKISYITREGIGFDHFVVKDRDGKDVTSSVKPEYCNDTRYPNRYSITVPEYDIYISTVWVGEHDVTVNGGTGSGKYIKGTQVSITASPAPAGKEFDKWTSEDGVTFDNAYAAQTTFTMLDKDVTVKANYTDKRVEPTPTPSVAPTAKPTTAPTAAPTSNPHGGGGGTGGGGGSGSGGSGSGGGGSDLTPTMTPSSGAVPSAVPSAAPSAAPTMAPAVSMAPVATTAPSAAPAASTAPGTGEPVTTTNPDGSTTTTTTTIGTDGSTTTTTTTIGTDGSTTTEATTVGTDGSKTTTTTTVGTDGLTTTRAVTTDANGNKKVTEQIKQPSGDYTRVMMNTTVKKDENGNIIGVTVTIGTEKKTGKTTQKASFVVLNIGKQEVTKVSIPSVKELLKRGEPKNAVALTKATTNAKNRTITIEKTVKSDGKTYTVTVLEKNLLKKNKKAPKKILIKATSLTKIEKNAFKGIYKKATIKVKATKKQFKKIKKMIQESGIPKKVKIKRV